MPPLLATSLLRVDVAGVPAIDGLTMTSTAEWVLVLGAPRALVEAVTGLRAIERGDILVDGRPPLDALTLGEMAGAVVDGPLPPRWTALDYATWSARMVGHRRAAAEVLALDALSRLELGAHARTRLSIASTATRRAAVIAGALATGAGTVVLEDPTTDLPAEIGRSFARIVVRALAGRRTVLFGARASLDSPIGLAAEEAIVVDGSSVALQGAPAQLAASERAYAVRLSGDAGAFAAACVAAGATLLAGPERAADMQLTLDLGALRTPDVLRMAFDCGATVLELRPLANAFA